MWYANLKVQCLLKMTKINLSTNSNHTCLSISALSTYSHGKVMTLRELSKIVPYNFSCIPRSRLLSTYCFILKGKDAWDPALEKGLNEILFSYLVWRREVISRESFHV